MRFHLKMIGSLTTLLVLFATSALTTEDICSTLKDGELTPHENCNQFYQCSNGIAYTHNCPPGLNFNEEKQVCDHPENVDCNRQSVVATEIDNFAKEASSQCGMDFSEGMLLSHSKCNLFYKCSQKLAYTFACGDNLFYNPIYKTCDWPDRVNCDKRKVPEIKNVLTDNENAKQNPSAACADPDSEGLLLPHENCKKFYECSGGLPVPFECPDDLIFDPVKRQCEWSESTSCDSDVDSSSLSNDKVGSFIRETTKNSDSIEICKAEDSEGELLPHEISCNKFYECSHGRPLELQCPEDLVYDVDRKRCDWYFNVDCGDRTI